MTLGLRETCLVSTDNLSVHFQASPEISFQMGKILLHVIGLLLFAQLKLYIGISVSVNWGFSCQIFWLVKCSDLQKHKTEHKIHLYINYDCSHTHALTQTEITVCLWFLGLVRVECVRYPSKLQGICLLTNGKKDQLNKMKIQHFSTNLYIVAVCHFHE